MRQVFIANPKGGCGKTMLATQIASYYADRTSRVALVDHDRQCSSQDWIKCRPDNCPTISLITAFDGEKIGTRFNRVIHDMPAACHISDLRPVANKNDQLIIPILPSPTDIKASVRFLMSVNRDPWFPKSGIHVALVANRVRINTNYHKILTTFLAKVNMPLITSIRETENYNKAMENGISIFDLPKSRVKTDLRQWQPLLDWLV